MQLLASTKSKNSEQAAPRALTALGERSHATEQPKGPPLRPTQTSRGSQQHSRGAQSMRTLPGHSLLQLILQHFVAGANTVTLCFSPFQSDFNPLVRVPQPPLELASRAQHA